MDYIITRDDSESLEHYGVKGMKWGVRHDRERTGGRVGRMASRDAKKAARAEHDFGAGSRTKKNAIARAVNIRTKRFSGYGEAYKRAYESQPHEKLARKAETKKIKTYETAAKTKTSPFAHWGLSAAAGVAAYGVTAAAKTIAKAKGVTMNEVQENNWDAIGADAMYIAGLGTYAAIAGRNAKISNARRKVGYKY